MTVVRRWTAILCLWLMAASLSAQTTPRPQTMNQAVTTPTQTSTPPVTAETDKDYTDPNALRISLGDALRTSIERNLGISLQSYDVQMAGEALREQYSLYDWFATGTLQQAKSKGAVTSRNQPSEQTATVTDIGVSQNLPSGGNYFLGFNSTRSTTTGGFTTVSPAYTPNLVFDATQPLLRNFGIDVTRRNILVARNTLGINREAFRMQLMDTAVTVEQAYYDLVYARLNVEVAKEALFLARDQARITQIRIDVGAAAPLDILQPRVQIATTEGQLITAVALVRATEDRLRAVMNLAPGDWGRPVIPTTPANYTRVTIAVPTAVGRAMDLRPELRQAELTTASRNVTYMFARNQVLPQLDFTMNYKASGVAGRELIGTDPVTGAPIYNTTSYNTALTQIFNHDFPSWTFGLNVGVPLSNIGAKAERRRAELDVAASHVNEDTTRQTIMTEVRSAARNVDTAALQIAATRTEREAAEQNVEAERRRYENGMATNFEVLQIQQQLNGARVSELQALVGYNEALATFHRQVGDILDVNGITVNEPPVEREPVVFTWLNRIPWLNYDRNFMATQPAENTSTQKP